MPSAGGREHAGLSGGLLGAEEGPHPQPLGPAVGRPSSPPQSLVEFPQLEAGCLYIRNRALNLDPPSVGVHLREGAGDHGTEQWVLLLAKLLQPLPPSPQIS